MGTAKTATVWLRTRVRIARRLWPFLGLLFQARLARRKQRPVDTRLADAIPAGQAVAQLGRLDASLTAELARVAGAARVFVDVERADAEELEAWHQGLIAAGLSAQVVIVSGAHPAPAVDAVGHAVSTGELDGRTTLEAALGSLIPLGANDGLRVWRRGS